VAFLVGGRSQSIGAIYWLAARVEDLARENGRLRGNIDQLERAGREMRMKIDHMEREAMGLKSRSDHFTGTYKTGKSSWQR
jgi:hypothetical protein